MAKTTAPPAAESTAVARRGPAEVALPDYIKKGDTRGTENIGVDDIRPPALRIAQGSSPEIKRANEAKFIPDLREGDFFNSITKDIYGEEPLEVVIIMSLGHRHVEFDADGNVLDFNVKDGDPRTEFTTKVIDGVDTRVKPKATKFYDYLIFVLFEGGHRELMTMSLKSTQLKKATTLNTLLNRSKLPAFAHKWSMRPVSESKGSRQWYGWRIEGTGFPDEATYNAASAYFDRLAGTKAKVVVDTEVDNDGDEDAGEKAPF
jgi:hypothetical protein